MRRWRGRDLRPKEQVANAWDSFVDLTPASQAPSEDVKAAWLPLQAGQPIPLIGEQTYGFQPEVDDPDEVQKRFDEANEKGFFGNVPDETPNENYTLAGVTSDKPTPENQRGK